MAESPPPDHSSADPPFVSPHLLLAAIVDSSDDAIISKSLQGIITSWNKGAERIFGYSPAEAIGKHISLLIPAERSDEESAILNRLRQGERVDHFETVRVHKNGRRIEASLSISPIRDESGNIVGASKIARDITEQKQFARSMAQANEELKRADRLKSDFIATLSHELRTPLSAIIGWIQILKDGPLPPEELREGIAVIERNARAQARMIEDLLDMSRIEAGKLSLEVQPLDLTTVVDSAIESIRPAADARQVRIRTIFSSLGGLVMGDKNRLQQVVWNLLTNAIKFTPKDGRVHVAIERVNSHVEISVSDNGEGISPEFLDRVFERFRQADPSTTRQHGGLGLGLTIVKQLVELHGGDVRAKSQGLGQGASFTVSLPLIAVHQRPDREAGGAREAAVDEIGADPDLSGVKVLAVDDDPDSVTVVKRILEARRAEVQTALSVEEALRLFATFQPDVVLSDIGMPGHDGYELVTRLRSMSENRAVPVVALTALARTQDRTRALRAGFQMHIAKPVDSAELVAVVMTLARLGSKESRGGKGAP